MPFNKHNIPFIGVMIPLAHNALVDMISFTGNTILATFSSHVAVLHVFAVITEVRVA